MVNSVMEATKNNSTPVQVSGLSGVIAIAAGEYHSLALKSNGTVWAWGRNNYGQLGIGTISDKKTPAQVSGLGSVIAIAAGTFHSIAIKSDGTVWSWGINEDGQLGDNTTVTKSINPCAGHKFERRGLYRSHGNCSRRRQTL